MTISSIGHDCIEQLSRVAGTLTIAPFRNLTQYLFPFVGAYFSAHYELRVDSSLEAEMPVKETGLMLKEIEHLTRCARIGRRVVPYVALSHMFTGYGGKYSITKPALFIPEQHLFRRGHSSFPQEKDGENLAQNKWMFSDDEVRFFIARELGQIKTSSSLLAVVIKIATFAASFIFYATPMGWSVALPVFAGAVGLYIISEKFFQAKADLLGVEILKRRGIQNPEKIALGALEKLRFQNLYRRENSSFARFYILGSGDNLLDITHPFLSSRIKKLQKGSICSEKNC